MTCEKGVQVVALHARAGIADIATVRSTVRTIAIPHGFKLVEDEDMDDLHVKRDGYEGPDHSYLRAEYGGLVAVILARLPKDRSNYRTIAIELDHAQQPLGLGSDFPSNPDDSATKD